jgi:hypothetical protein
MARFDMTGKSLISVITAVGSVKNCLLVRLILRTFKRGVIPALSTSTSFYLFRATDHHREVFSFWPFTKGDIRKAVGVIAGPVKRRNILHSLTIGPQEIVTDINENEVKQFSRLRFIIDHILCKAEGSQDNIPWGLYTLTKKHEKMQSPLV